MIGAKGLEKVRIAIHQPHYLPWVGYVDKMDDCELFVYLDHAQYERQGWQNRNAIKTARGRHMLTVPVDRGRVPDRIFDKQIAEVGHWRRKGHWRRSHWETIRQAYAKAEFIGAHASWLEDLYATPFENLAELNITATERIASGLGLRVRTVRSSELGLPGRAKTPMILDICNALGADEYLSGSGAREYLDEGYLERHGVTVVWQDFTPPRYPQCYPEVGFEPGLSALDLLLNTGSRGLEVLRQNRRAVTEETHSAHY